MNPASSRTARNPTLRAVRRRLLGSERLWGVLLAVVVGMAIAVQSKINGELGVRLGDGVLAAIVSFGTGLALLFVLVPLLPRARHGMVRLARSVRVGSLSWWYCIGGFGGGVLVATQALTVSTLGVAIFVVAVVAGQTASSLVVDRIGLGPGGRRPLTMPRVAGTVLTLLAVAGAMSGRFEGGLEGDVALWLIALPLLAGCGTGVQQAVNAQVRAAADSALAATLVNFLAGLLLLVVTWLVVARLEPPPHPFPTAPWLYVGGLLGAAFIGVAALVVRWTGVLLFGLAAIAGQLIGAVLLDLVVPAPGAQLQPSTVAGAALTLIAVAIAALPTRQTPAAEPQ